MKKLLFLGAGLDQSYAIQRARALGYYTIAIDSLDQAIGFNYAHQAIHMPVDNINACLAVARLHQIDGVMNLYNKSAMITAATIMSQLNLPGVSQEVADKIKNRFSLRSVLEQSQIMSADKIYLIKNVEEINEIKDFLTFPVILKAIDKSGMSRLLSRKVDYLDELTQGCIEMMSDQSIENIVVEEFIEGRELSFEIFVQEEQVQIIGVMEKQSYYSPEYHELGYVSVAKVPDDQEIRELIKQTIDALGIQRGSYNIEIISTSNHTHHILHVRAGVGGSVISSHIIPKVLRYKYLDNMIRASLGDPFDLPPLKYQKNVVSRKVEIESDYQVLIPEIEKFQKKYHVNVITNRALDIEELYVIAYDDSRFKAEVRVETVMNYILDHYKVLKEVEA